MVVVKCLTMKRLIFFSILVAMIACEKSNEPAVNIHESHIIYGKVTDDLGRAVEGVKAEVNGVREYTSSTGEYSLPIEETGTFIVTATPPDPKELDVIIFYDNYTSNEIVLGEFDKKFDIKLDYKSDAEIDGLIEKDVLIYKANSPINIPGIMAITAGNSVTIEPGTTVKLGYAG